MNKYVKEFIEENIELIDSNNFNELYTMLYEEFYDNEFVKSLTDVFLQSDIDVNSTREQLLYNLLNNMCNEALTGGEDEVHMLLGLENNWLGYTIYEVLDYFEKMSLNLGVTLIPTSRTIYRARNFIIRSL